MKIFAGMMIVCCIALVGCSDGQNQAVEVQEPPRVAQWTTVTPEDMTETQKAQQELCLAATNALASEMMGELMAALNSEDPTSAITVCGANAPEIAARIADEYGVKIGRTSHRLRNPVNTPPQWAEQIVADQIRQPTYLFGPGGEFGALLPIRLKAECQMCHGAPDEIEASIQEALAEHYPEDTAFGFAEGDLRGWYWVETPANDFTVVGETVG